MASFDDGDEIAEPHHYDRFRSEREIEAPQTIPFDAVPADTRKRPLDDYPPTDDYDRGRRDAYERAPYRDEFGRDVAPQGRRDSDGGAGERRYYDDDRDRRHTYDGGAKRPRYADWGGGAGGGVGSYRGGGRSMGRGGNFRGPPRGGGRGGPMRREYGGGPGGGPGGGGGFRGGAVGLLSFKAFMAQLDDDVTPSAAELKYEDYKAEYAKMQLEQFFAECQGKDWFRMRYDPMVLERTRAQREADAKEAARVFLAAPGTDVHARANELTDVAALRAYVAPVGAAPQLAAPAAGEGAETMEGEEGDDDEEGSHRRRRASRAASERGGSPPALGGADGAPSNGGAERDELAREPRDGAALGDERDDASRSGRRPSAGPAGARKEALHMVLLRSALTDAATRADVDVLATACGRECVAGEGDAATAVAAPESGYISLILGDAYRSVDLLSITPGAAADADAPPLAEGIDPQSVPRVRDVWALYSSRACAESARARLDGLSVELSTGAQALAAELTLSRPWKMIVQMDGVEDAAITRVCRALEPLCEKLDDARRLRSAGGSADAADGASDGVGLPAERLEGLSPMARFDLLGRYLREVHHVHVFGCRACTSLDELNSMCGACYLPGELKLLGLPRNLDADEWASELVQAAGACTEYVGRMAALDVEYGAKLGAALDKFYSDNTVEESAGVFLCPLSGKRFKGPEFVRKHIDNKHSEMLDGVRERVLQDKYVESFMLDPHKPPQAARVVLRGVNAQQALARAIGSSGGRARGYDRPHERGYDRPHERAGFMDAREPPQPALLSSAPLSAGSRRDPRPLRQYVDLDMPDDDGAADFGQPAERQPVVYE